MIQPEGRRRIDATAHRKRIHAMEIWETSVIIGTGARHSYFGHDDWAFAAPGLKGIEDALDIRRRLLLAFEAAERSQNEADRRAMAYLHRRRRRSDRRRTGRRNRRFSPAWSYARLSRGSNIELHPQTRFLSDSLGLTA
jgi:hypothetical protein